MKSFKQFTESSQHDEVQDYGDSASVEKHKAFIDKHLVDVKELPDGYKQAEVLDLSANRLADLEKGQDEEVYESVQEGTVSESEMTDAQKEKREVIVKELKKKMSEFKDRYGDKATDVMYATATKMAMKDDSEEDEDDIEESYKEGYYKEGVLQDLEMIVKKKSVGDVKFSDGKKQKVDLTTASMIVSMVKQLNKQNQKKVLNMLDNSKTFKDVAKFAFSAGKQEEDMSLLIKEIVEDVQYITEAKEDGTKQYFIEGIIMQGDIKNRNGRMYPKEILANEVKRYNETYVEKNRAYGELGHPAGPTINLDRVSHMFTELRQDGSNIVGRAKVMDTPMGKIVKNIMDEDGTLGISSRGMGSIKQNKSGIMEVQKDFMLATAGDIVADPSAPDAFVKGVMEGVDWIYDVASSSWEVANTFDEIEEEIKQTAKVSTAELEIKAAALFEKFVRSLTKQNYYKQ